MEIYFKNRKLQKIFKSYDSLEQKYGNKNAHLINRWLNCFRIAKTLAEISNDKPTRRHLLNQGKEKQYSIDVDHPFRLVIKVGHQKPPKKRDGGIDDSLVSSVMIMGIEDTHDKAWKASKTKFIKSYPLAFQDAVPTREVLKEYIDMHNLSNSGMADRCGISTATIEGILASEATIDRKTANHLEQGTKVSANVWLGIQNLHPTIDLDESDDEEKMDSEEVAEQNWIKGFINFIQRLFVR